MEEKEKMEKKEKMQKKHIECRKCRKRRKMQKKDKNADLVLSMSQKLEQRIQAEIGKDDGSELPKIIGIDWSLIKIDL